MLCVFKLAHIAWQHVTLSPEDLTKVYAYHWFWMLLGLYVAFTNQVHCHDSCSSGPRPGGLNLGREGKCQTWARFFRWGGEVYTPNSQKVRLRRAKKKRSPVSVKSFLLRGKNCHTPQPILAGDMEVLGGVYTPISPHAHVWEVPSVSGFRPRIQNFKIF
jgi:hypothetical protein